MDDCSLTHSHLNMQLSNLFWKKNFAWPKWSKKNTSDPFHIRHSFLSCWRKLSCLSYLTIWSQTNFGLDFNQLTVLLTPLKLRHLESWMTSSPSVMMVKCLFSLSWILALHLVSLTTVYFSIDSNMLSAYRHQIFRSFDPIWPKESHRSPISGYSSNSSTLRYGVLQC